MLHLLIRCKYIKIYGVIQVCDPFILSNLCLEKIGYRKIIVFLQSVLKTFFLCIVNIVDNQ